MSLPLHPLPPPHQADVPPTALAPMQDVTTLPFMRLIARYGAPDYFFTEFFRVYETSRPEKHIVASVEEIGQDHPIFAQIIGEDIPAIVRTMKLLEALPIAGIDLNMGCPAPKIYRKNVGGGLLRDLAKIDALLGAMRDATAGRFTVKMRVGFEDPDGFEALIEVIDRHRIDLLTIHGRTVKQMYRGEVDYPRIAQAKARLDCPVFANGNIRSAEGAEAVWRSTGVDGLMIGRAAIRNPWIFRQTREHFLGEPVFAPSLSDVRTYIADLWTAFWDPDVPDHLQANFLKKFLNFVGEGVDPEGSFLRQMRRARGSAELFAICDAFLLAPEYASRPFAPEPYQGVFARPNQEAPANGTPEMG